MNKVELEKRFELVRPFQTLLCCLCLYSTAVSTAVQFRVNGRVSFSRLSLPNGVEMAWSNQNTKKGTDMFDIVCWERIYTLLGMQYSACFLLWMREVFRSTSFLSIHFSFVRCIICIPSLFLSFSLSVFVCVCALCFVQLSESALKLCFITVFILQLFVQFIWLAIH